MVCAYCFPYRNRKTLTPHFSQTLSAHLLAPNEHTILASCLLCNQRIVRARALFAMPPPGERQNSYSYCVWLWHKCRFYFYSDGRPGPARLFFAGLVLPDVFSQLQLAVIGPGKRHPFRQDPPKRVTQIRPLSGFYRGPGFSRRGVGWD